MRKFLLVILLFSISFSKAESVLDSIIQVYHKQSDDSLKTAYGIYIIAVYNDNAKYDEAEKWINAIRKIKSKRGAVIFESRLTYFEGLLNYNRGNFREAADYFSQSLQIFRDLKDTLGIVNALNNLGLSYSELGNYTHAFKSHTEQIKLSRKAKLYSFEESGTINMVLIYLKKLQNRLVITESIKHINEWKNRSPVNCAILYQNMGVAYAVIGKYDSSLWAYQRAEQIFMKEGLEERASQILNNLGNIQLERKNYSEAEKLFTRSLFIKRKYADVYQLMLTLLNLSIVKMELGDVNYAIQRIDSIKDFAVRSGNLELLKESYKYKIIFNARLMRNDSLESWTKFYSQIIDSLYNVENSKQLMEMEQKYQSNLKEEQIKSLEKDKALQKTRNKFFLYGGTLLAAIIIILSYSVFTIRKSKMKIAEQKQKVDEAYALLANKNKEILDSIYYARRIQRALITNENYIKKALKKFRTN